MKIAPIPVKIMISIRKWFCFTTLTREIPVYSPMIKAGNKNRSILTEWVLMVCQTQIWKGSLNIFVKKNSQADVPINTSFGVLKARK